MIFSEPILISLLGGVSAQLLYLIDSLSAPKDRRPDFQSISYYLGIVFNIALSGILGYVYFDEMQPINKIVYFHIGLSAPLILRTLAATIPKAIRSSGENL